jgi:hypothetical protein
LLTALAQAASPALIPFDEGDPSDPVVVPPAAFFAIWGVIVLGCLAAAAWGFPLVRATRAPWRRVQLRVSLVQVGFVVWLLAAARVPVLTLPVFVGMLVLLVPSLLAVLGSTTDRATRLLLGGSLGLYTGWSAAAVWLNAATLLPALQSGASGVAPMLGLGALVLGAVATTSALTKVVRADVGYVLAATWALIGAAVGAATSEAPALAAVAAAGVITVLLVAIRTRFARPASG